MTIFHYEFMQKALLIGFLLSVIIPCIGMIVVLKRLSMIGDALSHSSLAGVSIGLVLGFNPILSSVIACVLAALCIEIVRKKFTQYSELSIAIIMSFAVGIAGIASGFVKNSANFNSFLFGSIVAITNFELYLVIIVSIIIITAFIRYYKELFYICLDERSAKLAGVNIDLINFIFTIITAITVSIAARTVGALVVSSLMVLPVACSLQIELNFKKSVISSIIFAIIFTISGLFASFYFNLKPGGSIVLIGVLMFIGILLIKKLRRYKI